MNILKHIPPFSKIYPVAGMMAAVAWNIPHLASVYADTVGAGVNTYHYVMVSIFEFSILIFAVKKYEYAAKSFATIIFILNLYYYFDFVTRPIEVTWIYGWFAMSRVVFAFIPAYLISKFSEMFANDLGSDWKTDRDVLEILRPELDNVRNRLGIVSPAFDSISRYKDSVIRIDGVKATICKCNRLVKAGSNRAESFECECGEKIEW